MTKTPTTPAGGTDILSVLPWVLAAAFAILAVIALIGWWAASRRARRAGDRVDAADARANAAARAADRDAPRATAGAPASDPRETSARSRQPPDPRVIEELIALGDLTDSPATRSQVMRVLERLDVTAVEPPVGSAFDAVTQNAAEARPTEDEAAVNTVAGVLRPGYRSAQGLVRPPDVSVWVAERGRG